MSTAITAAHQRAIIRHVRDATRLDEGSGAEFVAAILGEDPTYDDLAVVTYDIVAAELRARKVAVPAVRFEAARTAMALPRPGDPVCNSCGRLPWALHGSTWARVDGAVCPADQGLFVTPERGPAVVSWVDGSTLPAGTTRDRQRVPVTEAEVRASHAVDDRVEAALKETGASILDFLAALAGRGTRPAAALSVLATPAQEFVDTVALREFALAAKGALGRAAARGGAAHPPSVVAAAVGGADGASLRDLRETLASLYPSSDVARRVVTEALGAAFRQRATAMLGRFAFEGAPTNMWFAVLDEAQRQGAVEAIVAFARSEYPSRFRR